MGSTYWVDGYNLIFRKGWQGSGNIEAARRRLTKEMVGLGLPVVLFFDGSLAAPEDGEASPSSRVQLRFSRGQIADDLMIAELGRSKERKAITLVTDDRELKERAKALGANTVSVERFLHKLTKTGSPSKPPRRERGTGPDGKPKGLSQSEVDQWLKEFGFDEEQSEIDLWDPDSTL